MKKLIAALLLTSAFTMPAHAQEVPAGWETTAGAGVLYAPSYTGSDHYQLSAIPDVSVKYQDKFEASTGNGIRYNLVNRNGLRAGPIARYDFGRDDDGDSALRISGDKTDALQGLGDVDGAPELGGFVSYDINPSVVADAELRQAIGGHEGMVGDASVKYHAQAGGLAVPVYVSVGPRVKFASEKYNDAYFGVDGSQSAASGLSTYNPDGGLVSYGVGGSVTVPLSPRARVTAFAGYDRLASEVADSPIVEDRGSANQGSMGVMAGYTF